MSHLTHFETLWRTPTLRKLKIVTFKSDYFQFSQSWGSSNPLKMYWIYKLVWHRKQGGDPTLTPDLISENKTWASLTHTAAAIESIRMTTGILTANHLQQVKNLVANRWNCTLDSWTVIHIFVCEKWGDTVIPTAFVREEARWVEGSFAIAWARWKGGGATDLRVGAGWPG